jgi:hypothetical protein
MQRTCGVRCYGVAKFVDLMKGVMRLLGVDLIADHDIVERRQRQDLRPVAAGLSDLGETPPRVLL